MSELGAQLLKARTRKDWSLRDAEQATGIHNAHLSQIEKGVILRPSPTVLFTLAEAYELDFAELMRTAQLSEPDQAAALGAAFRTLQGLSPGEIREALKFMRNLKQTAPSAEIEDPLGTVNEFARRSIRKHAYAAIQKAGVHGVIPTPLDAVADAVGIADTIDIGQLPEEVAVRKPSWFGRVIGAVLFKERTVFIDRRQATGRQRFTEAHELSHKLLPWHERSYCLDDDRIFRDVEDYLDLEANVGATSLLFQNEYFHKVALDYETSVETPILLADQFQTSYHAAIRYYVEWHPDELGLLITGQFLRSGSRLPIWTATESSSFRTHFGPMRDLVPSADLKSDGTSPIPIGRLTSAAKSSPGKVTEELLLHDANHNERRFVAECWFNQHSYFIVLIPKQRVRLGRRVKVSSTA